MIPIITLPPPEFFDSVIQSSVSIGIFLISSLVAFRLFSRFVLSRFDAPARNALKKNYRFILRFPK